MNEDVESFTEWLFYRRKSKHSNYTEYSTMSHEKDDE